MKLPAGCPVSREAIVRDCHRIEERIAAAHEAIKVLRPDALQRLLRQQTVVRREDLGRMIAGSARNPSDDVAVRRSARRQGYLARSASAPGSNPMIGLPGQVAEAAGDHSVLEAALEEARRHRAEKFEALEWRQDVRPGEDPPFRRTMR